MTVPCPKGHQSTDADYCSECGLRLGAASTVAADTPLASSPPAGASSGTCPVCDTPRVAGARFCEVCRHDFAPAVAPASDASPEGAPKTVLPPPDATVASRAPPGGIVRNPWALVRADPTRMTEADRGAPSQRAFPLDLDENLVGRRNGRAGLHPEIPIDDPSVSARHLKICRRPGGALYAVDLGSTNGSTINGIALDAGVETSLAPGDEIVIGQWTTIEIEAR